MDNRGGLHRADKNPRPNEWEFFILSIIHYGGYF
ncbi:hypothetical protein C819_02385 [Lachnospiraceae bacterium 10-1]|nr:hypothetical protein C819_02385 [Lachnospiraceae bacterium 10-1]